MKKIKRDRLTYEQKEMLKAAGLITVSVVGTVAYIFAFRKWYEALVQLAVEEASN